MILDNSIIAYFHKLQAFSFAAGAGEVVSGFGGAKYMQDVNKQFCDSIQNNGNLIEGRLIDERDGKIYWVAKLKDGNCWMTQNLAYDLPGQASSVDSSWGSDNTASKYHNPGTIVYTTPDTPGGTWQDVTGWNASDISNYTQIIDATNKIYNAHYLQGNYYSWPAATDGACPGGWQLPLDGMYGALFTAYGTVNGLSYGAQDIRLAPLYFVYGGYVIGGTLSSVGSEGRYWMPTTDDTRIAYSLIFNTSTSTSNHSNRNYGLSVRCVAR